MVEDLYNDLILKYHLLFLYSILVLCGRYPNQFHCHRIYPNFPNSSKTKILIQCIISILNFLFDKCILNQ